MFNRITRDIEENIIVCQKTQINLKYDHVWNYKYNSSNNSNEGKTITCNAVTSSASIKAHIKQFFSEYTPTPQAKHDDRNAGEQIHHDKQAEKYSLFSMYNISLYTHEN